MKCPYCIKVCTECKRILVAWQGNFYKNKQCKYGVINQCNECKSKYGKQYYKEHRKEKIEYGKQYYEEHKEEKIEYNKQYYEEHKEEKLEWQKQYREEHREEMAEWQKQYREGHREEKKEYMKLYYEEHREEILEYRKWYYNQNKKNCLEKAKQYYKENPYKYFNYQNKRRSKLENQGRGITKEQWYEMMCWFDWCCAYSGEYIGNKENKNIRSIDHIVALDNNGLNEPWNCVPMFRPYNSSKFTNDMEEWYIQQEFYSEERLIKIYAWCEYAFNKWKPRRKGNRKLNFF